MLGNILGDFETEPSAGLFVSAGFQSRGAIAPVVSHVRLQAGAGRLLPLAGHPEELHPRPVASRSREKALQNSFSDKNFTDNFTSFNLEYFRHNLECLGVKKRC
jgi:hypothetical protein